MQRLTRDQAMEYEFDYRHTPKLRVKQGEFSVVETEDAGSGLIRSADVAPLIDHFPTRKFEPPKANPVGGPIFVEGAEMDAVESAIVNLMEWMVTEYSVPEREAYMHMCVNPDFRVNVYQMVHLGRLQYTVGAEIPKKYLI